MKTDSPGTQSKSFGHGWPTFEETDFHQLEKDCSAADAASQVNKRALNNNFVALAVIAPPKTLGELHKHWHKEAERRSLLELPKEMTVYLIPDIEPMLIGEGALPQVRTGGNLPTLINKRILTDRPRELIA